MRSTVTFISLFLSVWAFSQKNKELLQTYTYHNKTVELFLYHKPQSVSMVRFKAIVKDSVQQSVTSFSFRKVEQGNDSIHRGYVIFYTDKESNNHPLFNYIYSDTITQFSVTAIVNQLIDLNGQFDLSTHYDAKSSRNNLIQCSQTNIRYLCERKLDAFVYSIPPFQLKEQTYEEKGTEMQTLFNGRPTFVYLSGTPVILSEIVNYKGQLQCLVKWDINVKADNQQQKNPQYLLATSLDNGNNWCFTSFEGKTGDLVTNANLPSHRMDGVMMSPELAQLILTGKIKL